MKKPKPAMGRCHLLEEEPEGPPTPQPSQPRHQSWGRENPQTLVLATVYLPMGLQGHSKETELKASGQDKNHQTLIIPLAISL